MKLIPSWIATTFDHFILFAVLHLVIIKRLNNECLSTATPLVLDEWVRQRFIFCIILLTNYAARCVYANIECCGFYLIFIYNPYLVEPMGWCYWDKCIEIRVRAITEEDQFNKQSRNQKSNINSPLLCMFEFIRTISDLIIARHSRSPVCTSAHTHR